MPPASPLVKHTPRLFAESAWGLKLSRIAELTHDLDHRALPAFCGDARRRKQVDSLLIKGSNHDLEPRVIHLYADAENSRSKNLTQPAC